MENSIEVSKTIASPTRTRVVQLSTHSRHQSVPAIPSAQPSQREAQAVTPRGLAKLTLVERLSRDSSPGPTTRSNVASPRPESPNRLQDSTRSVHSRSRSRMSLSLLPAVRTTIPNVNSPITNSPLYASPVVSPPLDMASKHGSEGSGSDLANLSPVPTSSRSSVDDKPSLDDDANSTFLKLIASQERKVVELRDELARAEAELDLLKQQWTLQLKRTRQSTLPESNAESQVETFKESLEEPSKQPQILATGKRLAEGVRESFLTMMEEFKAVATNEGLHSPTKYPSDELKGKLEFELNDAPKSSPKPEEGSRPNSRDRELSSHPSTTPKTTTLSQVGDIPDSQITTELKSSPNEISSPWAWNMASTLLNQSQRHAKTILASVERHLDALAAGPDPPLRPRHHHRSVRRTSGHVRTETVPF